MVLDRNSSPYFNDYNEEKNYYEILFRPGFAVQARELSQLQTQLQKQIERFGKHVFKEGSQVIPGEIALDTKYQYVKVEAQFNSIDINVNNFLNKKLVGTTSGSTATVIQVIASENGDPDTLFVKYETGASAQSFTATITNNSTTVTNVSINATSRIVKGALVSGSGIQSNTYIAEIVSATEFTLSAPATANNGAAALTVTTADSFVDGETISTLEDDQFSQGYGAIVQTSGTGFGSRAEIKQGVYFALGYFCFVEDQTLILDKFGNNPSYKVGLRIIDEFVTEADDVSLVDPAQGSPNFNAPGAHRYKVSLVLSKFDLDEEVTDNFIELMQVKDGVIQKLVNRAEYSELEKTLARRTYDESGDYTVKSFPIQIKEHLNTGTNFGVYTESDGGDESKFVYTLDAGKAYVRGYEIELNNSLNLEAPKARDTLFKTNAIVSPIIGSYVIVDNFEGTFDISTYEAVALKATGGSTIGTAKVRGIEFLSGTPGTTGAQYKLYLFDVDMTSNTFANVRDITATGKSCKPVLESSSAVLYDLFNNISLFSFPEPAIKSFKNELGNLDTSYTVKRYYTGTMSGTSITLNAGSNELFDSFTILSYHLSITSASGTATGNSFANGDVINLAAGGNSVVLGGSPVGKQVTITVPSISGSSVAIVATVIKTLATQKTKTLTNRTQTAAHASTFQLDRADIFRINSITDVTTSQVITDRYIFDNGQRDNYYDRGRLLFKTGYSAPVGNISVNYDFFTHGSGDYFSVDSYDGVIDYKDIQTYIASDGTMYDLVNTIDFRPRINDAGNGFSSYVEYVANGEQFNCDYEYHVGRIDKIILDSTGKFRLLMGASGINPLAPKDPENAMVLYQCNVRPYTFSSKDIDIKLIDNRRYTMRDIGKLEKRINNMEYYTSLSLLEKETADLFIDDGTGMNRFKNGFIVDNFKSHLVGDTGLRAYQCSVDANAGTLRPSFNVENVDLELYTVDSTNYTKTGVLVTLPYTTTPMISQLYSSKTENINPYNVFSWVGGITLVPSSDDWFEQNQLADVIISNAEAYNNAVAALNGSKNWNEWTTTWIGDELMRAEVETGQSFVDGTFKGWGNSSIANASFVNANGQFFGANLTNIEQGATMNGYARFSGTLTETVVRQVGETRTGTMMTVVPGSTINEVIEDRVVNTTVIPWMRENTVAFTGRNLKPNTQVYPFFDGINVSAYCRPDDSNAVNGDALVTDISGTVEGTFDLPNDSVVKFRTGSRLFELVDIQSNNRLLASTAASAQYSATGILQTKQATIQSTQQYEIVQNSVTETRTGIAISTEQRTVTGNFQYIDPIAQTFLVDNSQGAFLSNINIFFATKDTSGVPVRLQIRNVINGVPGQFVVPFSDVSLNPAQVNVSETANVATSFTFPSPVYLEGNTEYCFVLLANSNDYNVWCSRLGEFDVTTGERISQQPYAGVMFKSANASTWTPDQEQDIKFQIFRCAFDDAVTANVTLRNNEVPKVLLPLDPFRTVSGNNTITVFHPSHGMTTGQDVTYTGIVGTHNGIPAVELNDTFAITYVDFDTYTIEFDSNNTLPTATGLAGGARVFATRNLRTDVMNIMAQTMTFPNTAMDWSVKTRNESGILSSSFSSVAILQNIQFASPQLIVNPNDEPSNKSVHILARMETDSEYVSPVIDTTRLSVLAISNRVNNNSTDETDALSGKALARYITKRIPLADSASGVRVYLAAVRPANATIKVYVKYQLDDDQTLFDDLDYVEMTAIGYPVPDDANFRDYIFELDELENFSVFSVKVVMLTNETSDVPVIRDFRAIALGT